MKRLMCLFLILLFILMPTGCIPIIDTESRTSENSSAENTTTSDPDDSDQEWVVRYDFSQTDYELVESRGRYFIRFFDDALEHYPKKYGDYVPRGPVFADADEFITQVVNGTLTPDAKKFLVCSGFERVHGFLICNPYGLFDPVGPQGYETFGFCWSAPREYWIRVRSSDECSADGKMHFMPLEDMELYYEQQQKRITDYGNLYKEEIIEDRNATVSYFTEVFRGTIKYAYTLTDGERELLVEEYYQGDIYSGYPPQRPPDDIEEQFAQFSKVPNEVYVYDLREDGAFYLHITEPKVRPSAEWLVCWDAVPHVIQNDSTLTE